MIEMNEDTYVYGVWFIPSDDSTQDWMGAITKKYGESWEFTYRFRYYSDEKAHDSSDRKSWYKMKSDGEIEKLVEGVNIVVRVMEKRLGKAHDFVLVDCMGDDTATISATLGSRPWAHMKQEDVDGADPA